MGHAPQSLTYLTATRHKVEHIRLASTWSQAQHIKRRYKSTHLKDKTLKRDGYPAYLERWSEQACSTLFTNGKVIPYTGS